MGKVGKHFFIWDLFAEIHQHFQTGLDGKIM